MGGGASLLHYPDLLHAFIEQAGDPVFLTDSYNHVVDANQRACESLGYTLDELIGMPLHHIEVSFRPEEHPELLAAIEAGVAATISGVHRRKNGTEFPVEVRVTRFNFGATQLGMSFVRDITERERAEKRHAVIAEASRLLTSSLDYELAMPALAAQLADLVGGLCAIDLLDHDGWIRRVAVASAADENALVEQIRLAVPTPAEPVGVAHVIRTGIAEEGRLGGAALVDARTAALPELQSLAARPLLIVPICGGGSQTAGALTLVAPGEQAIQPPDRTMAEKLADRIGTAFAHAESFRAAQSARERYQHLFESNPSAMWVFDVETLQFLAVNEAAIVSYGYDREQFLAMTLEDLWPQDERARLLDDLADIAPGTTIERRHVKASGEVIEVETMWHDLRFDGRPARIELARDMTQRKRLELELRHAQKLESIGRLAAGIAHEINTPIQFVGDSIYFLQSAFGPLLALTDGYDRLKRSLRAGTYEPALLAELDQLENDADLEFLRCELGDACERALTGIRRVAEIVLAMRKFAHPGSSRFEPADLNAALATTLSVARNEYKYHADVVTDFQDDLPPVLCRLGDLNQAFLNIVVNAGHAVADRFGEGTERGRIEVRTRRARETVEITISDTGCGIPARIRDRIFDPFFTTKEVGRGTGQGLAIAHAVVVEKHGGTLRFETEEGVGTTFIIGLPIQGGGSGCATDADEDRC